MHWMVTTSMILLALSGTRASAAPTSNPIPCEVGSYALADGTRLDIAPGSGEAWAVGHAGVIFRTTNFGQSWQSFSETPLDAAFLQNLRTSAVTLEHIYDY